MNLTLEGLRDREAWEAGGITLPSYDVEEARSASIAAPRWAHFGIGNIFRIFIGGIADRLIADGETDAAITCIETFDFEVVEKIYQPFDNLVLGVTLHADGCKDKRVLGSLAQAIEANASNPTEWERLRSVFAAPSLQMVSLTITEKGYALRGADGAYLPQVASDLEAGPAHPASAMAIIAAGLLARFEAGAAPLAVVSMDNCSRNGETLRNAVLEVVDAWERRGYVGDDLVAYVRDESRVAFPWTMIDKITPRPSQAVADELAKDGVEDMGIVVTARQTYIAPFVNAEAPQYLVVEDSFPNGRPALERAGVFLCDRETVNKTERMKVTVCLNPIHTALCTYDCLLGYDLFASGMADQRLRLLAELVGAEGMAVVPDPGILSPAAFLAECLDERFPNPYLGDTSLRIATDISQMVGIRFGETIKSHVKLGDADELVGIPLAIAGWLRYLLAVDDEGKPMELAPEPMLEELQASLAGIEWGKPDSVGERLRPLLSNGRIFGVDLYEAGLGTKVEHMLSEELAGVGSVRATLRRYLYSVGPEMRILVLNGSPRKHGGTAAMVAAFAEGARSAGHEVTVLDVAHMKIAGCLGCDWCRTKGEGSCVQRDDEQRIYDLWNDVDMLVLASPIYYGSFSGQLHCAIHRTYALDKPKRCIKCAMLLCSGDKGVYRNSEGIYHGYIQGYFKCADMGIFEATTDEAKSSEMAARLRAFGAGL